MNDNSNLEDWELGTTGFLLAMAVIPIMIIGLHYFVVTISSKYKAHTLDDVNYVSILKCFFNSGDFFSDLVFAMLLLFSNHYLKYFALIFSIVPHILSNIIAIHWMYDVRKYVIYTSKYVNKYDWLIIFLSATCGFYSGIELCQSKLFYLNIFNLQIKSDMKRKIEHWRFYNNVILENFPQMIIQFIYIFNINIGDQSDESDDDNNHARVGVIPFAAMMFSVLSLLIGVFVELSRKDKANNGGSNKNVQKRKHKHYFKVEVQNDQFQSYHVFTHSKLRSIFGKVLKIDTSDIQVFYIYKIRHGIVFFIQILSLAEEGSNLTELILLCGDEGKNDD